MRCYFRSVIFLFALSGRISAQSLYELAYPGAGATAIAIGGIAPAANLVNPAALALSRDINFNFVAKTPFHLNFIGASGFLPTVGTFSLSISQVQFSSESLQPDSTGSHAKIMERATIAFSKSMNNHLAGGISLHGNRMKNLEFGSATFSLLFLESRDKFIAEQYEHPDLFFNAYKSRQKYSLSLTYQDFSFNKKNLQGFTEIDMHYRHRVEWPFAYATIRTTGHDEIINLGMGLAAGDNLVFYSTWEDLKHIALGGSFNFGRQIFSLRYAHTDKKLVADFSFRMSQPPSLRAKKYWQKGVSLSRRGSYKIALREVKKFRAYNPLDHNSQQLENWLQEKVGAREEKIRGLLDQAESFIAARKYIKANLCYLEILAIDKNNRLATTGLETIAPAVDESVMVVSRVGKIAFDKGSYGAAKQAFHAIQQVRPEHAEAKLYLQKISDYYYNEAEKLFLRGLGYFNQKNYKMAVVSFEEALQKSADHAESKKYLQWARSSLEWQQKESSRILKQAKRFARRNDFKKASEYYQKILELDPQNQVARNDLRILKPKLKRYITRLLAKGKSAFEKGDFKVAVGFFRKAYASDKSEEASRYIRRINATMRESINDDFQKGELAFDEKHWQEAIRFYNAVLQKDESHVAARNKRKLAYQNSDFDDLLKNADDKIAKKDYLEAYELYLALQERDSNNVYIQSQVDTCRTYLQEEIERYFNSGISFFAAENYQSAIKEWDAVLRIDPHHAKSIEYKKEAEQRLKALNKL